MSRLGLFVLLAGLPCSALAQELPPDRPPSRLALVHAAVQFPEMVISSLPRSTTTATNWPTATHRDLFL